MFGSTGFDGPEERQRRMSVGGGKSAAAGVPEGWVFFLPFTAAMSGVCEIMDGRLLEKLVNS